VLTHDWHSGGNRTSNANLERDGRHSTLRSVLMPTFKHSEKAATAATPFQPTRTFSLTTTNHNNPSSVNTRTMADTAAASSLSAQEQARIRRERRQAKVREGGSVRLNRITATNGNDFRREGMRARFRHLAPNPERKKKTDCSLQNPSRRRQDRHHRRVQRWKTTRIPPSLIFRCRVRRSRRGRRSSSSTPRRTSRARRWKTTSVRP